MADLHRLLFAGFYRRTDNLGEPRLILIVAQLLLRDQGENASVVTTIVTQCVVDRRQLLRGHASARPTERLSAKGRGALSRHTGGRRKSEARVCKAKQGGPKSDPFLSILQVADELSISERSVWRLIEDGKLPTHRFGSSTRVRRSDLDDYIKRSRRQPPSPPDDEDEPPRSD